MADEERDLPVTITKKRPRPECESDDVYWTGGASGVLIGTPPQRAPLRKTYICRRCDRAFRYAGEYAGIHTRGPRVAPEKPDRAGLASFLFHDLRHHGATMALNAGFTAPIVMALGGWKTEQMMRRYAAVTDKTLRAAAEAVSGVGMLGGVGTYAIQR